MKFFSFLDTVLHFAVREDVPELISAVLDGNPLAEKLIRKANSTNELPEALARKLGAANWFVFQFLFSII